MIIEVRSRGPLSAVPFSKPLPVMGNTSCPVISVVRVIGAPTSLTFILMGDFTSMDLLHLDLFSERLSVMA
jgi:hypothetical protein|nr:hypothetical protein Q903MT_gene489 [Picea sitchensis]